MAYSSEAFRFRGHARRIARAVVDTMVPRWPGFEPALTDPVLERVERLVGAQPPAARVAFYAGLLAVELSGPPLLSGLRPFTLLDRPARDARLTRMQHSRVANVRRLVLMFQTAVNLCVWSLPEIEAYMGVDRRAWRAQRRGLHDKLVELDAARERPPVPEPLGSEGLVEPARFLDWTAGQAPPPAEPAPAGPHRVGAPRRRGARRSPTPAGQVTR